MDETTTANVTCPYCSFDHPAKFTLDDLGAFIGFVYVTTCLACNQTFAARQVVRVEVETRPLWGERVEGARD